MKRPFWLGAGPLVGCELFDERIDDRSLPFRCCIAGVDGRRELFIVPRLCVRESAIMRCVRAACSLKGRVVTVGRLWEKKCWLLKLAVRAIEGDTLRCKRPRLCCVGATGRRPVMKLAWRNSPAPMPR